MDEAASEELAPPVRPARRWLPRRVVITPAALDHPHGVRIVDRVAAMGLEVERPRSIRRELREVLPACRVLCWT